MRYWDDMACQCIKIHLITKEIISHSGLLISSPNAIESPLSESFRDVGGNSPKIDPVVSVCSGRICVKNVFCLSGLKILKWVQKKRRLEAVVTSLTAFVSPRGADWLIRLNRIIAVLCHNARPESINWGTGVGRFKGQDPWQSLHP